jgi:hypothetical protein
MATDDQTNVTLIKDVITLKDVFISVTTIQGQMIAMATRAQVSDEIDRDHESRLRKLESWRYSLPTSFLMAGAALLVSVLQNFHVIK